MEVRYNENHAADGESISAFVIVNGAQTDFGFRVVPAEGLSNPRAQVYCTLWKDAEGVEMDEEN